MNTITGIVLKFSCCNNDFPKESIICIDVHIIILLNKINFFEQRTPKLCLIGIRIPLINVVVHCFSEIRQLCKIKAILNCLFKSRPGTIEVSVEIAASVSSHHRNAKTGNKFCQRTMAALFDGLFTELGAEVHMLSDKPNGVNINDNCGSTHMETLMEYVKEYKLDCGVAFDGDADRCLAVDDKGNLVDGDFVMAICSLDMKSRGKLAKNAAVGTIMTNMGFIRFCEENGMKFVATKVGDRYVLEEMLLEEYNFGGEQSGHVIFLDFATTGDGQLTAAQLLSILKRRSAKLSSLATLMSRYPQVMVNVKVSNEGKLRFYTDSEVKAAIEKYKAELADKGRIIVRVSGTEPLIRVMVEGEDEAQINLIANEAAKVVEARLA